LGSSSLLKRKKNVPIGTTGLGIEGWGPTRGQDADRKAEMPRINPMTASGAADGTSRTEGEASDL